MKAKPSSVRAFTLTELVCVTAVILILLACYAGAIFRAYRRIKAFLVTLQG